MLVHAKWRRRLRSGSLKAATTMKTLRDIPVGATVTVAKLHGEGALKRRVMDMGITKGVEMYVRKVAPLGDPVEITVYALPRRSPCPICSSSHQ